MLSRVFFGVIAGVIVLAVLAGTQISDSKADTQAGFIPISVLADNQADYGVDVGLQMIPSISLEIIADKLEDEGKTQSSLPVIFFTSVLNSEDEDDTVNANDDLPGDRIKDKQNKPGNNGTNGNNGNGSGAGNGQGEEKSQEKGNNGNGKPENKNQEKNREKENNGNDKGKPNN